jgi:hypothetical protein
MGILRKTVFGKRPIQSVEFEKSVKVDTQYGIGTASWPMRIKEDYVIIGNMSGSQPNSVLNRNGSADIEDWTLNNAGISGQTRSLDLKPDGTKIYGEIFSFKQWTLTTPFDLTTAVYDGNSALPYGWNHGLHFAPNGIDVFVVITNGYNEINHLQLNTPWDFTSGYTVVDNTGDVDAIQSGFVLKGLRFYKNGNGILLVENSGDVYRTDVSSPYTLQGITSFTYVLDGAHLGGGVEIDEVNKKIYSINAYGDLWQFKYNYLG